MNYLSSLLRKWKQGERGFTLVELLVVIAIIGVLATLVLLQLGTARGRSRDTKRIADVAQIRGAVEQYYEDNGGNMPPDIDAAIEKYFSSGTVPTDPLDSATPYYYCADSATKEFQVGANLEQKAAALSSDLDWATGDFTADIGTCQPADDAGGNEDCGAGTSDEDCIYDQGNINS